MNIGWKIGIGLTIATVVGTVVFFGSRKAAAASSAKKAFLVSDDCKRIEMVDRDAAESALIAAATVSFRSMDEPAGDLLDRVLGTMFPQCKIENDLVFVVPSSIGITAGQNVEVPLGLMKLALHGKTVGDIKTMAESGNMPGGLSLEGASAPAAPTYIPTIIFGGITP